MAGNNGIQFLRGNSAQRANSNQTLLPGQPFYETDTTRLYVGNGKSGVALKGAAPVMQWADASGSGSVKDKPATAAGNMAVALGYNAEALFPNSVAIGHGATAAGFNTTVVGQTADTESSNSVAIGHDARVLPLAATGAIAIGANAQIGASSGSTSPGAIAIGYGALAALGNSIAVGSNASASTANTIVLGNANIKTLECAVTTITKLSDERTKEDIELANTSQCLVDVNRLPVKRFKYKKFARFDPRDVHITEFIAQDAQKVFPKSILVYDEKFPELDENGEPILIDEVDENGQIVYEEDGVTPRKVEKKFMLKDVLHMDTNFAVPTLWAAVQELTKITKAQQEKIDELEERVKKLEK